jgi:GH35 family endo-1,4-beta-xylanase
VDVVNEVIDDNAQLRTQAARARPGYIADAFRWAYTADLLPALPQRLQRRGVSPKSDAYYAPVQQLLAAGCRSTAWGPGHLGVQFAFPASNVAANLQRFEDLGWRRR